jgi:hypothetical protein
MKKVISKKHCIALSLVLMGISLFQTTKSNRRHAAPHHRATHSRNAHHGGTTGGGGQIAPQPGPIDPNAQVDPNNPNQQGQQPQQGLIGYANPQQGQQPQEGMIGYPQPQQQPSGNPYQRAAQYVNQAAHTPQGQQIIHQGQQYIQQNPNTREVAQAAAQYIQHDPNAQQVARTVNQFVQTPQAQGAIQEARQGIQHYAQQYSQGQR